MAPARTPRRARVLYIILVLVVATVALSFTRGGAYLHGRHRGARVPGFDPGHPD